MDFQIDEWMDTLVSKIKDAYKDRVLFIGLQGSYQRKEANEHSDIDIVLILDKLAMHDLQQYRAILSSMPYKEKACGFIAGKSEIMHWDKADLFQFYHDTQPIYGDIDSLLPLIREADVRRAIKIGASNLYHAACHDFLYEKSPTLLSALYKSAFFILQAKHFEQSKQYISSKKELVERIEGVDREILQICMERGKLVAMQDADLLSYYEKIIGWSSALLQAY